MQKRSRLWMVSDLSNTPHIAGAQRPVSLGHCAVLGPSICHSDTGAIESEQPGLMAHVYVIFVGS